MSLGVGTSIELFKLLAGFYVFDVLTIFGIPAEITIIIQSDYTILLARAMVGVSANCLTRNAIYGLNYTNVPFRWLMYLPRGGR